MATVLFRHRNFSRVAEGIFVSCSGKCARNTVSHSCAGKWPITRTPGPCSFIPSRSPVRAISSTSAVPSGKSGDTQSSSSDLHSLYHEQMEEISAEREAVFGRSDDISDNSATSHFEPYFSPKNDDAQPLQTTQTASPSANDSNGRIAPEGWDIEEAYAEREALFQFSEEEKSAWGNYSNGPIQQTSAPISQAMFDELMKDASNNDNSGFENDRTSEHQFSSSPFTHLTPHGDGVSMVDVGDKTTTRRVAVARSVVVFPPEVLQAFNFTTKGNRSEMVGPKGPIFETAKIAGIMGAKRTSELIPLCHPLPLDRVHIDIQLVGNNAIIECECRVTHRTGVEMEALMGASIAALTIYDMVKAVSHRVEIGRTMLVSKSGGKRNIS